MLTFPFAPLLIFMLPTMVLISGPPLPSPIAPLTRRGARVQGKVRRAGLMVMLLAPTGPVIAVAEVSVTLPVLVLIAPLPSSVMPPNVDVSRTSLPAPVRLIAPARRRRCCRSTP